MKIQAWDIVFFGLCLVVLLIPLPYGSVEEWSIFIFEAAIFVLFMVHLVISKADKKSKEAKSFYILAGLMAVFFVITILQIIPLPADLVEVLSPRTFDVHRLASQTPGPLTLSLAPALTSYELVKYAAYLLFAILVFRTINTRRRAEIFVGALLLSGLFQAIYGLTELWGGTGRIFSWTNINNKGSAFGTFVNRDHFSGFLEMLFPLALGYLLAKAEFFRLPKGLSLRERILWFAQERLQKILIIGLLPVLLGLAIVFSLCRTGILLLIGSVFLMSLVSPLSHGEPSIRAVHRHSSRFIRIVFVVVLFTSLSIGLAPVIDRFAKENTPVDKSRFVFYRNTIDLINSFFLCGSGPGTFVHTYPLEMKADEKTVLTHAHNDYLEILAESGIVAGGALILSAFIAFALLSARWLGRRDPFVRGIGLGALTGILAMLVHSMMDFNLRIPANAVFFLALYALAFRVLSLTRERSSAHY